MKGIDPLSLKCYVAGDATLQISGIHTTSTPPTRGIVTKEETDQIRKEQVQDVVDRINEYNKTHGILWEAGMTKAALQPYNDRTIKSIQNEDAYFANLINYIGGFYEIGERRSQRSNNETLYVDSFDWRNRHGQNWITIPKNQWSSHWCSEFAVAGTIEAYTNLYYNQPLDLDLSEPYLAYKCNHAFINSGYISSAFLKAKTYGVIDEDSYPFIDDPTQQWPISEPSCNERIKISNYSYADSFYGNDTLKYAIINHGPCASSFNITAIDSTGHVTYPGHAFGVVGFGKVTPDKMYFFLQEYGWDDTIITENDPRIGMDYWICKDSYYNHPDSSFRIRYLGHEGYMYIICNDDNRLKNFYYPTGSIQSINFSDDDIVVEDADGDGYYNWGIGPRPNNRLPAWAEQEEDGDDSNRFLGKMREYGELDSISYPTTPFVIDHNMTDTELADSLGGRFIRRPIKINQGITLTVTGELAFYKHKGISMSKNSTLVIDGGKLVDLKLSVNGTGSGRAIRIINGGTIECLKEEQFLLPTSISLEMDEGEIK